MADLGFSLQKSKAELGALARPDQVIEGQGGAEQSLGDLLKTVPSKEPVVPTSTGLEQPAALDSPELAPAPVAPLIRPYTPPPPVDPLPIAHGVGQALSNFFSIPYGFGMSGEDKVKIKKQLGVVFGNVAVSAAMDLDLLQRVVFAPFVAAVGAVKGIAVQQGASPEQAADLEEKVFGATDQVLQMSMAAGVPLPKFKIIMSQQEARVISELRKSGMPKDAIDTVIASMNGAREKGKEIWNSYPESGGDATPPVMSIHPDFMVKGFHGSPHDIKGGFSLKYNRTGEGSNVRGFGAYIADNPDVAGSYQRGEDTLYLKDVAASQLDPDTKLVVERIQTKASVSNIPLDQAKGELMQELASSYAQWSRTYKRAEANPNSSINPYNAATMRDMIKRQIKALSKINPEDLQFKRGGGLYGVELNVEQEHLLDLDKPLSEQTPFVREKIDQLDKSTNDPNKNEYWTLPDSMTGHDFYRFLSNAKGGDKAASEALDAAGIPGNRFLDRFSRVGGGKAPNFTKYSKELSEALQNVDNLGFDTAGQAWLAIKGDKNWKETWPLDPNDPAEARLIDLVDNKIGLTFKDTSNYVIFNDKNIRLLEKNGEPYQGAVVPKGWDVIEGGGSQPRDKLSRPAITKMIVDVAKQVGFPIKNILLSPSLRVAKGLAKHFEASAGRAIAENEDIRLNGVAIRHIVSIAMDSDDPRSTAFHEFFHPNQEFFTDTEKAAFASDEGKVFLRRYAADVKGVDPDHPTILGLSQRELEAYGTQGYIRARDTNKPIFGSPTLQRILDKFYQLIYNIRQKFAKEGITAKDVSEHYASGGMKGRVPAATDLERNQAADLIDTRVRDRVTDLSDVTDIPQMSASVKAPVTGTAITPKMKGFTDEVFKIAGVTANPHLAAVEQVIDLYRAGKIADQELWMLMQKHQITLPELQFAGDQFPINRNQVKIWQQGLSRLKRVQGAYDELVRKAAESGDPDAMKALQDMMRQSRLYMAENRFHFWYKQADATGRAFAVVLPKTIAANILGQVPRIGYDAVTALIDTAISRPFKWLGLISQDAPLARPSEAFNTLRWLLAPNTKASLRMLSGDRAAALAEMKGNAVLTQELLSYYPFSGNKLLSRYNADIMEIAKNAPDPITRGLAKAQGAAHTVNVLSRITEWWQRRAKFLATMDDYQRRRGSSIEEAINRLRAGEDPEVVMPIADVNRAVNEALSFSWAKPAQGPAAKSLVSLINNVPFASLLMPYPTFLLNAMSFVFQHTPVVGFLRLTSKAERTAFRAGDTRVISQQITGALAFILARKIVDRQAPGTKWDETLLPDGSYLSWSRLNPFTLWLFLADLQKRMEEGRIESTKWTDVFSAAGFGGRSNIGIGALDNSIDQAFDLSKSRTAVQSVESIPGNWLARFVVPLQLLKDIYAQFDADERKQRDASSDPLLGPGMKMIPGISQLLPEVQSGTREAAPTNPSPLRSEATGLLYREPKNSLEKEIDRLGFTYKEVAAGGIGDPELDRYARMKQGILAETKIMPRLEQFLANPKYIKGSNAYKGVILEALLKASKQAAVAQLIKEGLQSPYLFTDRQKKLLRSYLIKGMDKRTQSFMAEQFGTKWTDVFGE